MNVMERINYLLDANSFNELGELVEHDCTYFGMDKKKAKGDGLVTGIGKINGRKVALYAHDSSFLSGSSGKEHVKKICNIMDIALKCGIPIIALNDSSGVRIHEGVDITSLYPQVFLKTVQASGVVPQISLILGKCAGAASYTSALTDFIIMCKENSNIFLTSPSVIKEATNEDVTIEDIGNWHVHCEQTGLSHFLSNSEEEALDIAKELLAYLPQNNCDQHSASNCDEEPRLVDIENIIPNDADVPYNMLDIIKSIVDNSDFLEIHKNYAPNIVVCLSKIAGQVVGIVANQPMYLAGCMDIKASQKATRFIRFCDAFNIPIISLVDVPGFLPGLNQEIGGIIKVGAQLIAAYCELSVPKISIILRKAYGGAYATLSNKFTSADICYALPKAEISVMSPTGAVDIIFRKELKNSNNYSEKRKKFVTDYKEYFSTSYFSSRKNYIDGIIQPKELRNKLVAGLQFLQTKINTEPVKKHSTTPI